MRHTLDNSNGLVMVIRNYHWLNSASWVLISTWSAPLVQTGQCKQFSVFDFDIDLQFQASQGQDWPSCQKSRSNSSNRRAPTDKRTDTNTHTRTLPNVCGRLNCGHQWLFGVPEIATSQIRLPVSATACISHYLSICWASCSLCSRHIIHCKQQ